MDTNLPVVVLRLSVILINIILKEAKSIITFTSDILSLFDWKLSLIFVVSAFVTLLTSATVASRPAAVKTGQVAMSITIYQIFFMMTRFANMFYLPILASYVDRASNTGNTDILLLQIRIIIIGSCFGSAIAWLLLPTLVNIFTSGIGALDRHGSMIKVLIKTLKPSSWKNIYKAFAFPSNFGVSLLKLEGVPANFLIFNIFATAIWTVGVLCAMYASAENKDYARTAILLSGLVNALAAIMFSVIVDPKAALITDEVIAGKRPEKHVYIVAVFLMAGNLLGAIISQFFLLPGVKVISWATLNLNEGNMAEGGSLVTVVIISIIVSILASTTVVSRISAVMTRRVATAISIYNFFFLITRLAQQVYAPIVGSIVDLSIKNSESDLMIENKLRYIILGASIGIAMGFILMPTSINIYCKAIRGMEKYGSLPSLFLNMILKPRHWISFIKSFAFPSFLGVKLSDVMEIPRAFLVFNILVISIHTVGVMAATYASALMPEFARTATLLSSIVNGVATILIGIVVDPTCALITDQTVAGKRPEKHVKIMAIFLITGMFLGTLLSQVIFIPCVHIIKFASHILTAVF
ncbi:MAG TPA: DUF2837 family protein [Candidatus Eremiobacteraeota bacterium]|nr:DUF2837 family protein [Candidatus Eremiobacteraeota bacterium]